MTNTTNVDEAKSADAAPAPRIYRGLHLTPGTTDWAEHSEQGTPIRELSIEFPKDFGTPEERDFLLTICVREFDGAREFSRCSSDCEGFNVAYRIWSLLQCANDDAERQRVVDILNSYREPGEPEISLDVQVEGVIIFPGGNASGFTAESTRIYLRAGELQSFEHLRRETAKAYPADTQFRRTIYK